MDFKGTGIKMPQVVSKLQEALLDDTSRVDQYLAAISYEDPEVQNISEGPGKLGGNQWWLEGIKPDGDSPSTWCSGMILITFPRTATSFGCST
jgi:hypothetical protein